MMIGMKSNITTNVTTCVFFLFTLLFLLLCLCKIKVQYLGEESQYYSSFSRHFSFFACVLVSEAAEDLLFLTPVHNRSSLLVAASEGLLFSLSSCGTQTQAAVHERVRNTPVVLIMDLQYTKR